MVSNTFPAFAGKKNVPIVFSSNEYFVPCLAVMLRSVMDHASLENGYDIIVLHKEISRQSQMVLSEMVAVASNFSLRFIDVSSQIQDYRFFTANRENITEEAYYRLLIPNLLANYDKAVYLDCDMVACTDIAALYKTDVEDVLIAAARDLVGIGIYYSKQLGRKAYYDDVLNFENPEDYFISGILVMNLKRFRERFTAAYLLAYASSYPWQFHDQDVLNILCCSEKRLISPRWGSLGRSPYDKYLPAELCQSAIDAARSPYLFHFAGPADKPWHKTTAYSVQYFWPAAEKTPYYDVLVKRLYEHTRISKNTEATGVIRMIKDFLKKFLPTSARQSNYEMQRMGNALNEQKMLTLQLMLQLQRLQAAIAGEQGVAPSDRQSLLAMTAGRAECINRVTPKSKLAFEVDLAAHCNMRCRGCAHFSPLCDESLADFDEVERSFARLAELFDGEVEYIHLLGGEPLLHPRITNFVVSARQHFPKGRIEVVTNGLLLPKQPESFWQACRANEITLSVTKYPVNFDYTQIQALAALYGVSFGFYNNSGFKPVSFNKLTLDATGCHDMTQSFLNCYLANDCLSLREGRLYPCAIVSHIHYFNTYFDMTLAVTENDSIDIFAAKSGQKILDFVSRPIPFCKYCDITKRKTALPWGVSKKDITEWME